MNETHISENSFEGLSPSKSQASFHSSSPSKKFVIKSKIPTKTFNAKIMSSSSIPEIIDMKAMILPGKQGIYYKKTKEPIGYNNKDYMKGKISSMQTLPSLSGNSSPKKPQKLARLQPITRAFEVKVKKNQKHLDDLLSKGTEDSVDENQKATFKRMEDSLTMSVEESKDEDIFTPAIMKSSAKSIGPSDVLNLASHNLKDETLAGFLGNLSGSLKKIYLMSNFIGALSGQKFSEFLVKGAGESKLIELDLEETEFNDELGVVLFTNLNKLKQLKVLNLTSNYLTHLSSNEMKSMLATNTSLKELYLRRNKLTGLAGANIFQGLYFNSTLKVLDLSWNLLAMKVCAEALAKLLKNDSCTLVHLDISFNNFSFKESVTIKEAIEVNHQLYGFHYEGNFGYVDWKGFLKISEHTRRQMTIDYNNSRRIKGLKAHAMSAINFTHPSDENDEEEILYKNACWLCNEWHETVFELSMDELSDMPSIKRVFIHLDIDGFNGSPMSKPNEKGSKYILRRMLPPSRVTFFFTVNELQITSERFYTVKNPNPILTEVKIGELMIQEIEMPELNYLDAAAPKKNKTQQNQPSDPYMYHPGFFQEIRVNEVLDIEPSVMGGKVPKVQFRDTAPEIQDVRPEIFPAVISAFKYDFENTKISSLAQDPTDERELKTLILRFYAQIKDVYQYLSALSPTNNMFCINQKVFAEFAKNCNLIDDRYLRISDVDVLFFTVYTPPVKVNAEGASGSGKYLLRSQFIEAIVKISIEKYVKTGLTNTTSDAFERLLLENVLPNFRYIEGSQWKSARFLTEKNEVVIKRHWAVFEHIYKANINRKPSGIVISNPPNMLFYKEFQNLIFDSDLVNKNFTEKDANVIFRMSLGFHDEDLSQEHNRNMMLNFNEFIEAIARVAEKIGIVPVGEKENDMKWTVKLRSMLPLHVKTEALIMVLLKKVCSKEFVKSYRAVEKSEYGDDINQVFLTQMRGSVMQLDMNTGRKGENKTYMKNYLQKAIKVAILMNKVTKNLMRHDVRKSEIDTPYH